MQIKEQDYNKLLAQQEALRDKVMLLTDHTISDLKRFKGNLEDGFYEGLAGKAQNTWELYLQLGRLQELTNWINRFDTVIAD